ncbi:MAG: RNA polymerase sigma factor [Patescibacteria group bacterium]|nr:RNA polymerase sigma factor [Patescibacteria group bacterium]
MTENKNFLEKTDEELAVLALGSKDYFLYLMRRYEAKLLAYILRISSFSHDEAEDVLQEVFIKIYKNLNDFDKNLKFSSWAYRITHNQVISHYRKAKARPQSLPLDINDKILANLSSDLDIEKEIEAGYFKKAIKKVLANLDIKYREVLVLKFLEERSYKEISDILKKPMGTIATLINRAKKEFREELDRQKIKI